MNRPTRHRTALSIVVVAVAACGTKTPSQDPSGFDVKRWLVERETGPLVRHVLDRKVYYTDEVREHHTEFERVFAAIGALQQVHSKSQLDLINTESIFTVLELGKVNTDGHRSAEGCDRKNN